MLGGDFSSKQLTIQCELKNQSIKDTVFFFSEEDANLAKKIQERHEKAKEARRARKEEIRDKVELFDFRKREIKLLHQLEEDIEVSKLHDKYNQRDQKADEVTLKKRNMILLLFFKAP